MFNKLLTILIVMILSIGVDLFSACAVPVFRKRPGARGLIEKEFLVTKKSHRFLRMFHIGCSFPCSLQEELEKYDIDTPYVKNEANQFFYYTDAGSDDYATLGHLSSRVVNKKGIDDTTQKSRFDAIIKRINEECLKKGYSTLQDKKWALLGKHKET